MTTDRTTASREAELAREAARARDGKFGEQHHSAPDVPPLSAHEVLHASHHRNGSRGTPFSVGIVNIAGERSVAIAFERDEEANEQARTVIIGVDDIVTGKLGRFVAVGQQQLAADLRARAIAELDTILDKTPPLPLAPSEVDREALPVTTAKTRDSVVAYARYPDAGVDQPEGSSGYSVAIVNERGPRGRSEPTLVICAENPENDYQYGIYAALHVRDIASGNIYFLPRPGIPDSGGAGLRGDAVIDRWWRTIEEYTKEKSR